MSETGTPATSKGNGPFLFFLGLLLGAGAASAGFYFYDRQQQRAVEEKLAQLNVLANAANNPGQLLDAALNQGDAILGGLGLGGKLPLAPNAALPATDETKVTEVGKGFIADLESNRIASAYRSTSDSYQKDSDRKVFDALIAKHPGLRRLDSTTFNREQKVRKIPDGKSWEFYFTGRDRQAAFGANLVNVALTLTQVGDDWRVAEIEITSEK